MLLAAHFLWIVGDSVRARNLTERIFSENPSHEGTIVLRGWIDATAGMKIGLGSLGSAKSPQAEFKEGPSIAQLSFVESAVTLLRGYCDSTHPNQRDPEAVVALAHALERLDQSEEALALLSQLTSTTPTCVQGWLEKSIMHFRSGDYDAALGTLSEYLGKDPKNLLALRLDTLYALILPRFSSSVITNKVNTFITEALAIEGKNAKFLLSSATFLARLSSKSKSILGRTISLLEAALKVDPLSTAIACELGYQKLLAGDVEGASASYNNASSIDSTDVSALIGLISVQVAQGLHKDAEVQLSMFEAISETIGQDSRIPLLQAQIKGFTNPNDPSIRVEILRLLQSAKAMHLQTFQQGIGTSGLQWLGDANKAYAPYLLHPPPTLSLFDFYALLSPELLFEIAKAFLVHPSSNMHSSPIEWTIQKDVIQLKGSAAESSLKILSILSEILPTWHTAPLLMAKVHASTNDYTGAQNIIAKVLERSPENIHAYLLLAQIAIDTRKPVVAMDALAKALANSFALQNDKNYLKLRGQSHLMLNEHSEAVTVFDTVIRILQNGYSPLQVAGGTSVRKTLPPSITHADKRTNQEAFEVYLYLVEALIQDKRFSDAEMVLSGAVSFSLELPDSTPKLAIHWAKLHLAREDPDAALERLQTVPPHSSEYAASLLLRGEVFLKHRRDPKRYIECYELLVQNTPKNSPAKLKALLELGHAQLTMGNPEDAVLTYQNALTLSQSLGDSGYAEPGGIYKHIGAALVASHNFTRALAFYEDTLRLLQEQGAETKEHQVTLRSELVALLVRLGRTQEAERLSQEETDVSTAPYQFSTRALKLSTKNLCLLASAHMAEKQIEKALEALDKAQTVQSRVLALAEAGASGQNESGPALSVEEEKEEKMRVCILLGQAYESLVPPDDDKAWEVYGTAVSLCPDSVIALLARARCAMKLGNFTVSREALLRAAQQNPLSEEVYYLLSELLSRNGEVKDAIFHLEQLLSRVPCSWGTLYRLAGLYKRMGRLQDISRHLRNAVRSDPSAESHPGYKLILGLQKKCENKSAEAAKILNVARVAGNTSTASLSAQSLSTGAGASSPQFSISIAATETMVWLYLSPDGDPLWTHHDDPSHTGSSGNSLSDTLRIAEQLLDDIPRSLRTAKHEAMRCLVRVLSRDETAVADAMATLATMLEADQNSIPALFALSVGLMITQQFTKARNQIKRLLKTPAASGHEYNEECLQGWLLLADAYAESGRVEQAQQAVQRALTFDASAGRAWEYLGSLAERGGQYNEAAEMLERAWKAEGELSSSVGFKLAFNYLKAGKFTKAVDVAQKVLAANPAYPRIREEILERAKSMIRL